VQKEQKGLPVGLIFFDLMEVSLWGNKKKETTTGLLMS